MAYCENCGNKLNEGVRFCSKCGQNVTKPVTRTEHLETPSTEQIRTGKPIAGGILIIIASCFCIIIGILSAIVTAYQHSIIMGIVAIFTLWGFSIGLTAAILSFRRTKYALAITGSAFVIVGGGISFLSMVYFVWEIIFAMSTIILILGILGTIFIAVSKNEFT